MSAAVKETILEMIFPSSNFSDLYAKIMASFEKNISEITGIHNNLDSLERRKSSFDDNVVNPNMQSQQHSVDRLKTEEKIDAQKKELLRLNGVQKRSLASANYMIALSNLYQSACMADSKTTKILQLCAKDNDVLLNAEKMVLDFKTSCLYQFFNGDLKENEYNHQRFISNKIERDMLFSPLKKAQNFIRNTSAAKVEELLMSLSTEKISDYVLEIMEMEKSIRYLTDDSKEDLLEHNFRAANFMMTK